MSVDAIPGQVNILMLKKQMDLLKQTSSQILETMPQAQQTQTPKLGPPGVGQTVDMLM